MGGRADHNTRMPGGNAMVWDELPNPSIGAEDGFPNPSY
jgi:hypothetical protein